MIAVPIVVIGIIIALLKVAEMTFLLTVLSMIRLSLNAKSRVWSVGTDSYSDLEVGYVSPLIQKIQAESNQSLESRMNEDEEATEKIQKL